MTAPERFFLALSAACVIGACSAGQPILGQFLPGEGSRPAAADGGTLELRFAPFGSPSRAVQATIADIHHVTFDLQAPKGVTRSQDVAKADMSSGGASATARFPFLWPGVATVSVTAFDAQTGAIGTAAGTASVRPGETTVLDLEMTLAPTYITAGDLIANLNIRDGGRFLVVPTPVPGSGQSPAPTATPGSGQTPETTPTPGPFPDPLPSPTPTAETTPTPVPTPSPTPFVSSMAPCGSGGLPENVFETRADFQSTVQGYRGWRYQSFSGGSYTDDYWAVNAWGYMSWRSIFAGDTIVWCPDDRAGLYVHPSTSVPTVLTWVPSTEGRVLVSGHFESLGPSATGLDTSVKVGSTSLFSEVIAGYGKALFAIEADVTPGVPIHLTVGARAGNNNYDTTRVGAQIRY